MSYLRRLRQASGTGRAIVAAAAVLTLIAVLASAILALKGWPPHLVPRIQVIGDAGGSWDAPWDAVARAPSDYQNDALLRLISTVIQIGTAAVVVSMLALVLNGTSRLLEQWRALAIRHALGATMRHLLPQVCRDLFRLSALGSGIGLAAGFAALAVLGRSWPVVFTRPALVVPALLAALSAFVLTCLMLGGIGLVVLLLLQRGIRLSGQLHGTQVTRGGAVLLLQSVLATLQLAALLAVTNACLLILNDSSAATTSAVNAPNIPAVRSLAFTRPAPAVSRRETFRGWLAARPGSLASDIALTSPDAWLGYGKALRLLAICGECHIGQFFKPFSSGTVRVVAMTPDVLHHMAGRYIHGRDLSWSDSLATERFAVLNSSAASLLFPGGEPVGKLVRAGLTPDMNYTVAGVIPWNPPSVFGNGRMEPVMFVPLLQHPPETVEASATPRGADWLSRLQAGLAGDVLAMSTPHTLTERLKQFMDPINWFAVWFGALSAATTGIAAYSLVEVMSQTVRLREREIAIRMALGATPSRIERWVTGRSLRLTGIGVYLGISGARWVAVVLHGPSSGDRDIALMGALIVGFGVLGLLSSWWPARRAARVQPAAIFARPAA